MGTRREPSRYLVPAAIALVAGLAIAVPAACQRIEEPSISPDPRGKPSVVAEGVPSLASAPIDASPTASPRPALASAAAMASTALPGASPASTSVAGAPGVCPPDPDAAAGRALFERGTAAFVTPDGKRHAFRAELARSPDAQERGLMFRTEMAQDEGMVFEFETPHAAKFWMHNTCIALDMIFVGEDARVLGVVTAPPLNDEARFVNGFSKWVVELPAGAASKLGIAMGTTFEAPKR